MKSLDRFMESLDQRMDRIINPKLTLFFRRYCYIIGAAMLLSFFFLFTFKVLYDKPYFVASLINRDLKIIKKALKDIDKDCSIASIKHDEIIIDFLNVKSFRGSVVGGINLDNPKKWRGPYLKRNPTIQQKFYELIKTEEGFFIVPGKGVELPNNLVVGENFQLKPTSSIVKMLEHKGSLFYKDVPLSIQITFKSGSWNSGWQISHEKINNKKTIINKIGSALKELNEAMPFTEKVRSKYSNVKAKKTS